MDWQKWIQQSLPRTEIMRGGATIWPKGGDRLIGDTLGPVMHLHDHASEIFYFVSGRCRLQVGNTEEFFTAGDFVLVPPQTPHNLWNASDEDLAVFWLVAPHFMDNKWRTSGITDADMAGRVQRIRPVPEQPLPSDANIHSRLVELTAGKFRSEITQPGQEVVLYVRSGNAQVQVGKLSGILQENEFVHVPVNTTYKIQAESATTMLFIFQIPGGRETQ